MSPKFESILADAKAYAWLIGATIGIATAAWGVVSFLLSLQPRVEAIAQHEEIKTTVEKVVVELHTADEAIDAKASAATRATHKISRDTEIIKCMLLAPSMKVKSRCGLE